MHPNNILNVILIINFFISIVEGLHCHVCSTINKKDCLTNSTNEDCLNNCPSEQTILNCEVEFLSKAIQLKKMNLIPPVFKRISKWLNILQSIENPKDKDEESRNNDFIISLLKGFKLEFNICLRINVQRNKIIQGENDYLYMCGLKHKKLKNFEPALFRLMPEKENDCKNGSFSGFPMSVCACNENGCNNNNNLNSYYEKIAKEQNFGSQMSKLARKFSFSKSDKDNKSNIDLNELNTKGKKEDEGGGEVVGGGGWTFNKSFKKSKFNENSSNNSTNNKNKNNNNRNTNSKTQNPAVNYSCIQHSSNLFFKIFILLIYLIKSC